MVRALIVARPLSPLHAATPLYQTSIDKPQNYTVVRGVATPDTASSHNNSKSLRVEPGEGRAPARWSALARPPHHRQALRALRLGAHRRPRQCATSTARPIATGAALSMASMPFDVHSASLGGTQPWTRLSLQVRRQPRAGSRSCSPSATAARFRARHGSKASASTKSPPATSGPRAKPSRPSAPPTAIPSAGWIYLHIEGKPYERGYQHGHLMAREIPEYLERCAADLGSAEQWNEYRTTANALFLRGFDREILEEMRGIAEGAADAGAKWQGRRIDLVDIVVANVTVETRRAALAP